MRQSCACMHGCCRNERADQGVTSSMSDHRALCMYRRRRLPACGVQAGCAAGTRPAVQQLTLAVPAVTSTELSPAISLGPPQQRRSGRRVSRSSCDLQRKSSMHLRKCQSPSSPRISGLSSKQCKCMCSTCAGPRSTTLVELAAAARACTTAGRRPEGAAAPPCCRAAEQRLFDSLHPPAAAVSHAAGQCAVPSAARQSAPREAGTCTMLGDLIRLHLHAAPVNALSFSSCQHRTAPTSCRSPPRLAPLWRQTSEAGGVSVGTRWRVRGSGRLDTIRAAGAAAGRRTSCGDPAAAAWSGAQQQPRQLRGCGARAAQRRQSGRRRAGGPGAAAAQALQQHCSSCIGRG